MIRDYLFPETIDQAVSLLGNLGGKGRIIAGGTDLIVGIREKEHDFEILVDVERIGQVRSVREQEGRIFIGAGVTFAEVERSELIRANALALCQAASLMGGPQIRNRGTIGGNIVSAQPAADGALALFAFDAVLEIATVQGIREIPIDQAYKGLGKSLIDPSREVLIGIWLRRRKRGEGSNYQRIAIRRALQLPILACSVFIRTRNGSIEASQMAIGPVADFPFRAARAEEYLLGKPLSEEVFKKAGKIVSGEVNPRDSKLRGNSIYRKKLAAVIVRQGLLEAAAEAGWGER